jgi:hypothetical protein
LGYGKEYKVVINDPFSGKEQGEVIDLSQFGNKEYDGSTQVELHKNEFEFTLPQTNRKITFMITTESKDRKVKHKLSEEKKKNRKLKNETSSELTTRLKETILSVDGEYDQRVIDNFVDNELFAQDSRALRTYIKNVSPDMDLEWEFISEETGEGRMMSLPMDITFFWPED